MAHEQRPNSGVLFKNDRKEQDKHPDYKGWGEVNGRPVWISAWVKSGAKGKFMSLAFQDKDEQQGGKPRPEKERSAAGTKFEDFEDDLPF